MTNRGPYSVLTVSGGSAINGSVRLAGFKHSLVLSVAYLIGRDGPARVENVPDLYEVEVYEELLPAIGVVGLRRDRDTLSWQGIRQAGGTVRLPASAARIHGSLYLLPALVASGRPVGFGGFGGCQIGDTPDGERPWRHVVDVLCRFGATFRLAGTEPVLHAPHGFTDADIDLLDYTADPRSAAGSEYSGATKAAALAAALGDGRSVLRNPYLKAELRELLDVIESTGVSVWRNPGDVVIKVGDDVRTSPMVVRVAPDLMEAATWITAVGVAGGKLEIRGITMELLTRDLPHETRLWRAVGIDLADGPDGDSVTVGAPESGLLDPLPDIEVRPDGIYSDCQPLFAVLATRCAGVTTIRDRVWSRRYAYAEGLARLGADVTLGSAAVHIGPSAELRSADQALSATDLRCAAAYVLASLRVPRGVTVTGAHHLRRGYSGLLDKLRGIGVHVDTAP